MHLAPADPADPGDQARAGHFALVQIARRELADFEERRARVEQPLDAVARQQFAARGVAVARFLGPAQRRRRDIGAQLGREPAIMLEARLILVTVGDDLAVDPRRAHRCQFPVRRKYLAPSA